VYAHKGRASHRDVLVLRPTRAHISSLDLVIAREGGASSANARLLAEVEDHRVHRRRHAGKIGLAYECD
jgi:hypothetical protein